MSITMGQLASRMAQAASKVDTVAETKLRTLAQVGTGLMKEEIQAVHAVDTSSMLNSTRAEKAGPLAWEIGPTVGYSIYVALGTSRMAARPFHITSAQRLAEQAGEILKPKDLGL
jgi:hypothetical protein